MVAVIASLVSLRLSRRRARAYRRRADQLAYAAETIADVELCRDVSAERNELRRAAAHADQRASVLEGLARGKRS
jgi:hypothetical protein